MEDVCERLRRNANRALRIQHKSAPRSGVVAIGALGAPGVHGLGVYDVGRIICLLRRSGKQRASVASQAPLQWLFVLRDDAKFLRHVKWRLGASERVE